MRILGIFYFILLTGCVQKWVRPGADANAFKMDSAQCDAVAWQRAPVRMVTSVRPADQLAAGIARVEPQPSTRDENLEYRAATYESCLLEKGWSRDHDNQ